MSYTALYRKFRPASFEEVKGQDVIVTTLKNQILSGRIGHAYLFCGTRGTGKTSVAKLFAKAVNCENTNSPDPCGCCASCRSIASGSTANVIEIDAASNNSVDNVREIREEVAYRPTEGKYKVYIIDEAHMLSIGAFNALLKTLEEPPEYVIFILATTEAAKIPVTILSRCQRYDFKRIGIDRITERMQELLGIEGVDYEEKGVRYIARMADGSMRDALSLLDQCISCCAGERLTYDRILEVLGTVDSKGFYELLKALKNGDVSLSLEKLRDFVMEGKEMSAFTSDFIWYLRNVLLAKKAENIEDILDVSSEEKKALVETANEVESNTLIRFIRVLSETGGNLRSAANKRVLVEMALIRLCKPESDRDTEALTERIRVLEEKLEKGISIRSIGPEQKAAEPSAAEPEKQVLKRAAPEELKKVREQWPKIRSGLDNPLKSLLSGAELSYSGDGGDDRLFITGLNETQKDMALRSVDLPAFEAAVTKAAGALVEIVFVGNEENRKMGLANIPLEKKVTEAFAVPIEIE